MMQEIFKCNHIFQELRNQQHLMECVNLKCNLLLFSHSPFFFSLTDNGLSVHLPQSQYLFLLIIMITFIQE